MCHSGSGFAQGTLRARVQGNLARSTWPDVAVDGTDAGTDNVREAMYGAWAVVVVGVHGMVQEDTHWGVGAVSRNHVGPLEHGFGSTRSLHPHLVAVQAERDRRLCARQCCYSQTGLAVRNCCSRLRLRVVALNTDKMMHETECSEKMYLAGEEVAEAEEVDIAHTQVADSCLMNSGPPDRGAEEEGQVDIEHKVLQAYHIVHSSQRHWDMRERSVAAEEAGHMDHKQQRRSVAADIEYSVAGSGRIDAVAEAGVVGAGVATMTDTAQGMVVVVDVGDDVGDELTGEGELGSGAGVDVGLDGVRARERDVGAEVVVHT